jgi:transcriptional regulator with XRE-family HTH domain
MEMSEVIRRRRTELGMSQADLGAAAGVDARQIRRYEAGQSQPALSVAVAIADALGTSLEELAPNSRDDGKKKRAESSAGQRGRRRKGRPRIGRQRPRTPYHCLPLACPPAARVQCQVVSA